VIRITKNFSDSGGNAYVGIDISSYAPGKKLKTSPYIFAGINAATDTSLAVTSIRRENDSYFIVFLNKAATAAFNINAQFLVE